MSLLHLNEDVLNVILQCLSPYQALQFGMTSRYAHVLTVPRRLSKVTLWTPYMLRRFCDFCLASKTERPQHIVELIVKGAPMDTYNRLAEVIQHATQLRIVNIGSLEHVLRVCPGLDEALRTRTTLTHISLADNYDVGFSGGRVHELVSHIASPIVDLDLGWWYLDTGADWWTMIAALAPTLRTFRLMTLEPDMQPLPPPPAGVICPRVDTLHLSQAFAFHLDYFARFFPNVRTLEWFGYPLGDYWRPPVPPLPSSWATLDRIVLIRNGVPPLQPDTRIRRVDMGDLEPDLLPFVASVAPAVLMVTAIPACTEYVPLIGGALHTLRYLSYKEWCPGPVLTPDVLFRMASDLARTFAALPLVAVAIHLDMAWQEGHYPAPEGDCDIALAKAAAAVALLIKTVTFACIKAGRSDARTGDGPCLVGWFEVRSRDGVDVEVRRLPWWEEDALEDRLLALT